MHELILGSWILLLLLPLGLTVVTSSYPDAIDNQGVSDCQETALLQDDICSTRPAATSTTSHLQSQQSQQITGAVRAQYEQFPYPPATRPLSFVNQLAFFASGTSDSYKWGTDVDQSLDYEDSTSEDGISRFLGHLMRPSTQTLTSPSNLAEINHFVFQGDGWSRICSSSPGSHFSAHDLQPFRVLMAGGGTGEKTLTLISQLVDMDAPFELIHLDLAQASLQIALTKLTSHFSIFTVTEGAKHPNRNIGSDNMLVELNAKQGRYIVTLLQGDIADILSDDSNKSLRLGSFDYIDLSGVLHHCPNPLTILKALQRSLKRGGGIGVLVYGAIARRPVYDLKTLHEILFQHSYSDTDTTDDTIDKGALNGRNYEQMLSGLKKLLLALPATHPLRQDAWRWKELNKYIKLSGKAGLVDLFLHAHDQAMSIDQVIDIATQADLKVVTSSILPSCAYDINTILSQSQRKSEQFNLHLKDRFDQLKGTDRLRFMELFTQNMHQHILYLVSSHDCAQQLQQQEDWFHCTPSSPLNINESTIPIPLRLDPRLLSQSLAASLEIKLAQVKQPQLVNARVPLYWNHSNIEYNTGMLSNISISILSLIDGQRTLGQIYHLLQNQAFSDEKLHLSFPLPSTHGGRPDNKDRISWSAFLAAFQSLYDALHSSGRLLLSTTPIKAYEADTSHHPSTTFVKKILTEAADTVPNERHNEFAEALEAFQSLRRARRDSFMYYTFKPCRDD